MRIDFSVRDRRRAVMAVGVGIGLLLACSVAVSVLQERIGVPNPSAVYLLAVVGVAVGFGTVAASFTAVASFFLYDFLFTQPVYTFAVSDPDEWLNLGLLLAIGLIVGRLAAEQRNRAEAAVLREREAVTLFKVSRALATREETTSALQAIIDALLHETAMARIWIALDPTVIRRATADTDAGTPLPTLPATAQVLSRIPGDVPAKWLRVHEPVSPGRRTARDSTVEAYRVNIEAGGRQLGAVWALRSRSAGQPSAEQTRMLAAAADQIGQALEQDRLRQEATSAELARRSDAIKTALLDSVSHDLRTPLASIRAAAGSLMDPHLRFSDEETRASAATIDAEADRLNRLVTNLLDMSRIEAGGLRADIEPYPLDALVETSLRRFGSKLADRTVDIELPEDLPLVTVDATFMDQILTNVIENALKYAPPPAPIRISARGIGDRVRLVVEDGGPGVPAESLPRLFEKFYRVARTGEGARRGTGVGLAVVRGLVETMGGEIVARPSPLGGLALIIDLPIAAPDPAADSPLPAPPPARAESGAARG